jgi:hypothetical protein
MINLFIPYYVDKVPARQDEIDKCIRNNRSNASVDRIFIIHDGFPLPAINDVTYCLIHYRPTYNAMFDIINSVTGPDDWNVLINSDIYTDETIGLLNKYTHNDFIALARWDVDKNGNIKHHNTWDSQDTWAFKGKARKMNADFFQGIAGCDNAIANRAHVAGYNVLNPSKTIKTYHLHNSGVRNYNPSNRVPQPYKMITPHE